MRILFRRTAAELAVAAFALVLIALRQVPSALEIVRVAFVSLASAAALLAAAGARTVTSDESTAAAMPPV